MQFKLVLIENELTRMERPVNVEVKGCALKVQRLGLLVHLSFTMNSVTHLHIREAADRRRLRSHSQRATCDPYSYPSRCRKAAAPVAIADAAASVHSRRPRGEVCRCQTKERTSRRPPN